MRKVLVIQVAGLGWPLWERAREAMPNLARLADDGHERRLLPPFPAVTVTAQATFTTGTLPNGHGMVANGLFHRDLNRAMFWEQSAALVEGESIWQTLKARRPEARTAMLFWQNSVGSGNDVVLTPAPIHKHGHGVIDSCYSVPGDLYDDLTARLGPFRLRWYWGPFVSVKGSEWIARATADVLREHRPDLALTYLPHLDYEQQRRGPDDPAILRDAADTDALIGDLIRAARELDYAVLVWGDYAIGPVSHVLSPNAVLRQAGLLNVRRVRGREYLDLGTSAAFAMVDHQVAHVFALPGCHRLLATGASRDSGGSLGALQERVVDAFAGNSEAVGVIDDDARRRLGLDHPRSGEVILEAQEGWWFDYRWWEPGAAPDFAGHVDIHNKPGFDPGELFKALGGLRTGTDPSKVRGSHGRRTHTVLVADEAIPLPGDDVVPLQDLKDAVLSSFDA